MNYRPAYPAPPAHLAHLKARRARLLAESRRILDVAEKRGGELTEGEERDFDRLHAEAEKLNNWLANGGAPVNLRCDYGTEFMAAEDDTATRALRPGETCREYLASRGKLEGAEEFEGLTFGRYLRSMVVGPRTDVERRALSEGTDSAGGFTVPDILGATLIDALRPRSTVLTAGAKLVPLDSDQHAFARVLTDPTPAWRSENAAAAEADPTFERVLFSPQSLAFITRASRELLEDSVNLESALPAIFAKAMAQELDRVALIGSGTAPEPLGISGTTGVGSVSMGTNGAPIPDYDPFVDARQLILDANAEEPTTAVMAPRTGAAIAKFGDANKQPLKPPPAIAGVQFFETTQLPVNETQGTSSNASRIIVGGFGRLWIGVRSEVRVEVLKERYADFVQVGFLVTMRADIQLEHPESFAQIVGIIP